MSVHLPGARAPRRARVARTITTAGFAGLALVAWTRGTPRGGPEPTPDPVVRHRYGAPVALGRGQARSYVALRDGAPVEIGVALDERALDGLPAPGSGQHGAHGEMHEYILPLPLRHGTPFRFVELDWNPGGHEPPGVYDAPHFDFHFYTIDRAERDAIDPANARYAERANALPAAELIPEFYGLPLPPGTPPVAAAVPRMGVHLLDMRSPEIQRLLGKPDAYRPFTTTFIHGAWDGRITFFEPMITRAHLLARKAASVPAERDQIIPLPLPRRYGAPGSYPGAYRIQWDEEARVYRVALTHLRPRS